MSVEYEKLVKQLYEGLLDADGVKTVDVRHDVKIVGKSGATHQIDLYWEFQLTGISYKTCIECKHYSSKIKKSHIAAFTAILEDIGNVTGIFASTVGYQAGALLFAKERGIRLIKVNFLLKAVTLTTHITAPSTEVTGIIYNKAQASRLLKERGLNSFSMRSRWSADTIFFDESDQPLTTLKQLFKGRVDHEGSFSLVKPGVFDRTELGLIEVEEIRYNVRIFRDESTTEIQLNDTEKAILEDVVQNTACYLNDDGSVTNFSSIAAS